MFQRILEGIRFREIHSHHLPNFENRMYWSVFLPPVALIMGLIGVRGETPEVELFQAYLRINTSHPNPDYGSNYIV